jgi:hypothetical protein
MSSKIAVIFAIAFVLVAAPLACGGGEAEKQQVEEAKEQATEQAQEAKEQAQEAKGDKTTVAKYEDLPEEVKAKMTEEAKQKIQ